MQIRYLAALVAVLCGSATTQAVDKPDWLQISGFGTGGAFRADSSVATVRADNRTSSGSLDDTVYDQDSLLALQLNIQPKGPFNAGFQFISKKNIDATNRPRVQWAYLGWQPTEELNFKAGRSVAPIFLMSDYRDVYYSQTAARPHGTVYYNNPITFNDGVTGQWEPHVGDNTFTVEAFGGKTNVSVAQGAVDVPRQKGISFKWSRGPFSVRAGAFDATVNFTPTPGGPTAQFLQAVAVAPRLGVCANCQTVLATRLQASTHSKSWTAGMAWDTGDYAVQGEYSERTSDSLIVGGAKGWYVQASKRFGDFTPYGIIGRIWPHNDPIGIVATPPANPSPLQRQILGALAFANATNVVGQFNRSQDALGVRWDFHSNMDLKLQWDRYKLDNPRWGSAGTVQYAMTPGSPQFSGRVNAYTLNFDFIF